MDRKSGALLAAVLAAACALLIFPAQAAHGAENGLRYSLSILIPSLYPFMVLSVFVVKSGLSERLGRVLEKPTQALFRLPGNAVASVIMSIIGGYPAGARSAAALYESGAITQEQVERMMCFCVNAGPSFVITAVGIGFLKSAQAGNILFVSQLVSFFAMGILSGIFCRRSAEPAQQKNSTSLRNCACVYRLGGRRGLLHADDVLFCYTVRRAYEPPPHYPRSAQSFRFMLRSA